MRERPHSASERYVQSLWRRVGYLAVALLFAAIGVLMIRDAQPAGWFLLVVFGLASIVFLALLLPGASCLVLDAEGFTCRALFRRWRERWADIEHFAVVTVGSHRMVGWRYRAHVTGQARGRAVSRAVSGVDGALPDTYGHSPEALVERLEAWRQRQSRAD
jgi:hypothetical protein